MVMLWLLYLLLGPPQPALGQVAPTGRTWTPPPQHLSCVNDFVNKVDCGWAASGPAPPPGCRVRGLREARVDRQWRNLSWSCELRDLGGNQRGCSFLFEDPHFRAFSWAEALLGVQVVCNGTTMDRLPEYVLRQHVQMNPPGRPNISSHPNETRVSWSPGSPLSRHLQDLNKEFELQIKHSDQPWQEARTLSTLDQELRFPSLEGRAGPHQARVRVRPPQGEGYGSRWSAWGPVASWDLPDPRTPGPVQKTSVSVLTAGPPALGLLVFITLLFMTFRYKPRLFRTKPVPDPSKYFPGRCSLPGPGLKMWLNPGSTFKAYFISVSPDSISPVAVAPPPPSSVSAALLHPLSAAPCPSSSSYVSSDSSSSSSSSDPLSTSCFSNPTYSPDDGPPDDGSPDDGPPRMAPPLHLGPFAPAPVAYQPLGPDPPPPPPTEPQSPDSGVSLGAEDWREEQEEEEQEEEEGFSSSWEHGLSRVFLLAARSSPEAPPSTTPSGPNQPPRPWTPTPLGRAEEEEEEEEEEEDYDAYEEEYDLVPVGGAMGRSSSMPVEPCSGYHTLKDLQTTYSSISI